MIIVKLLGGLGNQMFQYALGRQLAILHNTDLKLDITEFETYKTHAYALNAFAIQARYASRQEIYTFTNSQRNLSAKFANAVKRLKRQNFVHIQEKHFHFDPIILHIEDDCYLEGYWQSFKYFSQNSDLIHQDFQVKSEPDSQNRDILASVSGCESIAVHVRRGDYVLNQNANQVHGTCSIDYYLRALRHICEQLTNPQVFFFSDNIDWVKNNFVSDYPSHYIDHNGAAKNYEDIRLMAACKHNIIANSTFSWWGAWLNKNPNKRVVAPKNWFAVDTYNTKDLLPPSWQQY